MSSHTLPGLGLAGGRSAGESGWADEMNLNLLKLSAVAQLSVKSRATALPVSPSNGDIYIVPSGDATNPNKVAVRDAGAWTYLTPAEGWLAWVQDEDGQVVWNGSTWTAPTLSAPMDVGTSIIGLPGSGEKVLRYVFARAVTFSDDFAGSYAKAGVAATASATFDIQKNGATVGSLTFAVSGTTGTFTTSGGSVSFAAGDVLTIVAPSTADATLADIAITLAGLR